MLLQHACNIELSRGYRHSSKHFTQVKCLYLFHRVQLKSARVGVLFLHMLTWSEHRVVVHIILTRDGKELVGLSVRISTESLGNAFNNTRTLMNINIYTVLIIGLYQFLYIIEIKFDQDHQEHQ